MTEASANSSSTPTINVINETSQRPRWGAWLMWAAIVLSVAGWAIYRLDLFPLSARLPIEGDTPLPRALFTVDHPFHTARADLLRTAWESLDTVRWVANHQGGYPAEFYPFGIQAVAAALSLATFGVLSIESSWSITIALVFLLPGVGFALLGWRDRLAPAVAVIALAAQVAIASDWTHGGFSELVEWGLATNVAGFTLALLALPLMSGAVESRSPRSVGAAAAAIALCALVNPRSLISVAIVTIAIVLHGALRRRAGDTFIVVGIVGVLAAALAAPVIAPLLRYSDLYFFLSYQEYASLAEYWDATTESVTWPVLLIALIGVVLSFTRRSHRATQVAAITLALYMSAMVIAVASPAVRELIPQLELPRLMPYQRLLTLYFAAYGAVELARRVVPVPIRLRQARDMSLAVVASVALLLVYASDLGPFPPEEQGLRHVPRTEGANGVELVQFRDAVALADSEAADETAVLVIGSRLSWHEQLWAPMEAPDRRFYYNDWLWYWHRLHDGPYDYRSGHFYPNPSEALDPAYLQAHGIGAVIVTDTVDQVTGGNTRLSAQQSEQLAHAGTSGAWEVYTVRDSTTIASLNGEPASSVRVSEDGETIRATFEDSEPGTVTVRQNWFPRWKAEVNGSPVPVERSGNGYMEIETDGGDVEIALRYTITSTDAIARILALASALAVGVLLISPRPIRRWERR